ncbi:MAG: reverse transcriptase family protein, partial [Providencia heimbachae]|nr:reverse transcriptase family protein [Providencia heimbachae]
IILHYNDRVNNMILLSGGLFTIHATKASHESHTDTLADVVINRGLQYYQVSKLKGIINKYRVLFEEPDNLWQTTKLVEHEINTGNNKPINSSPYRTSMRERKEIQAQISEMLAKVVIRNSNSHWASPVVLVKKKSGEWRFCVDYRKLNNVRMDDKHLLPLIEDILTHLNGAIFFPSLDLKSGYWQIPVRESVKQQTAFVTSDGLFECNVLPFGLKTSPATFHRCLDRVLGGLKCNSCLIYLDDVIIMATDIEEHNRRLQEVFDRLKEAGLRLNPKKCNIGLQ